MSNRDLEDRLLAYFTIDSFLVPGRVSEGSCANFQLLSGGVCVFRDSFVVNTMSASFLAFFLASSSAEATTAEPD